jgi:PAS domain S-box-containing protein
MEKENTLDKLFNSMQFFRSVMDILPGIVWILDASFNFIWLNKEFEQVSGYSSAELIGKDAMEISTPEGRAAGRAFLERCLEAGSSSAEGSVYFKNGRAAAVYLTARLVRCEGVSVIVAIGMDISARVEAEEAAREAEQRLRDVVFSGSDWIWESDANDRFSYCDGHIARVLGYEPEEMLGRNMFDFLPPEESERVRKLVAGTIAQRKPVKDVENVNMAKDGRRICLLTNAIPVFDKAGEFRGYTLLSTTTILADVVRARRSATIAALIPDPMMQTSLSIARRIIAHSA